MNLLRIAIGLALAGFLVWTHILAHDFGADGVRLEVAQQSMRQIERAQDETRTMQEKANAAQVIYTKAQSDIAERDRRIRRLVDGMRDSAPTTDELAQHSIGSVSRYAAEAERDFAECRAEFAEMGRTAAGASAAAHALKDTWPVD